MKKKKIALLTGITGQDGSYLAELLLSKGYEVHGIVRRVALEDPHNRMTRINHIKDKLHLHPGNIESYPRMIDLFDKIQPDECYHLAAQSFVFESFEDGFSTLLTNINGTNHVLSALYKKCPKCKFYFAASSEMFGKVEETPQKETTRFHPRSPYGISKVTGYELTRNYRETHGIFACSGILFNHESPRRGFEFVTRKISGMVAKIRKGEDVILRLGDLNAKRDWGFSGDFVEAMWMMLQHDKPDDYVIATGETHSVREFVEEAFKVAGININSNGKEGLAEKYFDDNGKVVVEIDPLFFRPAEVELLMGDPSKAQKALGWKTNIKFKEIVKKMVEEDIRRIG